MLLFFGNMNQEDLNKISKQIQDSMHGAISTIAKDAVKEALAASASKMEKVKTAMNRKRKADSVHFNKKAHEDQFKHNQDLDEKLDDALEAIDEGDTEAAKTTLNKGKKIIKTRMKLLRIADREGWLAVNEFRTDELASDDEEEKKLRRAIRSANALREKLPKSSSRWSSRRLSSPHRYRQYRQSNETVERYDRKGNTDNVLCYNCRRLGYLSDHCPFPKDDRQEETRPREGRRRYP